MIQVDVFWSFAMGASLATLAGDQLKESTSIFANKYFAYTVKTSLCPIVIEEQYWEIEHNNLLYLTGWVENK